MPDITSEYSITVDSTDKAMWEELLQGFDDATIHQTWSVGAISQGERNLSNLILRRDGEVVAMAQISVRKFPFIKAGIATVYWGPIWRRKGKATDYTVLDKAVEALKNEYVANRCLLLRIWPIGFENSEDGAISTLKKHGFIRNSKVQPYRTLLLDISPSLEELRKNLAQKWRNQLNTAEKSNLSLMEGSSDEMYHTFLKMLHEMVTRKNFETRVDYDQYQRIQNDLPEFLKMNIIVCSCEGEPVSAGIISAIGDTGIYLLGATANKGLRVNGSNLIHWRVINWLKERGYKWYDLGGIDPSGNPGVYNFKRGIAGKIGLDVVHVGQFYLARTPISHFLSFYIDWINRARIKLRRISGLFH